MGGSLLGAAAKLALAHARLALARPVCASAFIVLPRPPFFRAGSKRRVNVAGSVSPSAPAVVFAPPITLHYVAKHSEGSHVQRNGGYPRGGPAGGASVVPLRLASLLGSASRPLLVRPRASFLGILPSCELASLLASAAPRGGDRRSAGGPPDGTTAALSGSAWGSPRSACNRSWGSPSSPSGHFGHLTVRHLPLYALLLPGCSRALYYY